MNHKPTVLAIRLQNFMAFADTNWLELQPISLLFGRNSTGKSVITRALQLLRQSVPHANYTPSQPLSWEVEGGVNLKSFADTLHQSAQKNDPIIRFHFRCQLPTSRLDTLQTYVNSWREEYQQTPLDYEQLPDWLEFSLGFSKDGLNDLAINCPWAIDNEPTLQTIMLAERLPDEKSFQLDDPIDDQAEVVDLTAEILGWVASKSGWLTESDFIVGQPDSPIDWSSIALDFAQGFFPVLQGELEDDPSFQFVKQIMADLGQGIENFLNKINHIGPLRPEPQWYYLLDERAKKQWRETGYGNFCQFLEETLDEEQEQAIGAWINTLGLGSSIEDKRSDHVTGITVAQIAIKQTQEHGAIKLPMLGSGTAQVLPIIIESIAAQPGTMIIIEQPELHLHPRAQAQLADMFIEQSKRGVRFLIETHSEHLLLRMRRRIAETTAKSTELEHSDLRLGSAALGAYFVHRHKNDSSINPIEINSHGDIIHTPLGFEEFFADDLRETVAITRAKLMAD